MTHIPCLKQKYAVEYNLTEMETRQQLTWSGEPRSNIGFRI